MPGGTCRALAGFACLRKDARRALAPGQLFRPSPGGGRKGPVKEHCTFSPMPPVSHRSSRMPAGMERARRLAAAKAFILCLKQAPTPSCALCPVFAKAGRPGRSMRDTQGQEQRQSLRTRRAPRLASGASPRRGNRDRPDTCPGASSTFSASSASPASSAGRHRNCRRRLPHPLCPRLPGSWRPDCSAPRFFRRPACRCAAWEARLGPAAGRALRLAATACRTAVRLARHRRALRRTGIFARLRDCRDLCGSFRQT